MTGVTSQKQEARLRIFDASGRVVRDLSPYLGSSIMHSGSAVSWDGRDDRGKKLPAGVYIIRCTAGEHQETQKAVMLR